MNNSDETDIDYDRDPLMVAARQLPPGIAPNRDLWPGIAEAIAAERAAEKASPARGRPAWNGLFAQAAAVLLLVGGSSGVTWLAMKQDMQPISTEPSNGALQFRSVAGNFGSQYHLGPDFLDARNDLAARLDDELARLSPETQAEVRKNLDTIRAAIMEINAALVREPDNALLQGLLMNAYRDELAVMSRIDGMANSAMRRTDI
jgi:hypothetical protein